MLYVVPQFACASIYGSCILSYDFGNRSQSVVTLPGLGNACFQKCQTECAPFFNGGASASGAQQINDQAAKCMNLCQSGQTFTGFITQSVQNNSALPVFRNLMANSDATGATYSYTTQNFCSDADLNDSCGIDTGIVRPLGGQVYVSFDVGGATNASVIPPTNNFIFACGYNEVALEPVMYAPEYSDWYHNTPWFDANGNLIKDPQNGYWLAAIAAAQNSNNTPSQFTVQGQHPCLGILTQNGLQNITNWNLWGGYHVVASGAETFLQSSLWGSQSGNATIQDPDIANNTNVQAEFFSPSKISVYNYQNTCNWHARNLNPVYTGVQIRDGDYLKIFWTHLANSGYQSLGGMPNSAASASVSASTPGCLPNSILYKYYANQFNSLIDPNNKINPYSVEFCPQVLASNYFPNNSDYNNIDWGYSYLNDYDKNGNFNGITGPDIVQTCATLLGYTYNYNGPSTNPPNSEPCIFGNSANCGVNIGSVNSLFSPLAAPTAQSSIADLKFMISETSPESKNYGNQVWSYDPSDPLTIQCGANLNCTIKMSGLSIAPNSNYPIATDDPNYCACQPVGTNPPEPMDSYWNGTAASNNSNFLSCKNFCSWQWCDSSRSHGSLIPGINVSCKGDKILSTGCYSSNPPPDCLVPVNPHLNNFHCYPQNYSLSTSQPSKAQTFADGLISIGYRYETCRGADMPIIWDAARKKMFISTALTHPTNSLFGTNLLPGLAKLNYFMQANNRWQTEQWSSFGGGLGFRLFCQGLMANDQQDPHQAQADLINRNSNLIYTVYRNSKPLSRSYAIGGNGSQNPILIVSPDVYDKVFANLTHHYDYLQAIGALVNSSALAVNIPDCTEIERPGCSGPYSQIISLMASNQTSLPVVPVEYASGTCGTVQNLPPPTNSTGPLSYYGASTANYTLNDPLYEWMLRSSLEVYLGNTTIARYSPNLQKPQTCYTGPTFAMTGAMFNTSAFQNESSINNQSSSCSGNNSCNPPSPNLSNFASSWQNINNFYGLLPNLTSAALPATGGNANTTNSTGTGTQTIPLTPPVDFVYQVEGVINGIGASPQALSLRHPSRDMGQPDKIVLWNQLGGTNAYVVWGGCPVSQGSPNLQLQYKIIDPAGGPCTPNGSNVIQDWTAIPDEVISSGAPLNIGAPGVSSTSKQGQLLLRARLQNDSDSTFTLGCSGTPGSNTCAKNRFGAINLNLTYLSDLTGDAYSNVLGDLVTLVFQTLFGDGKESIGIIGIIYNALINESTLFNIGRAVASLYIAVLAIQFMLGMLRDPHSELIKNLIKVAFVLVATSPQSFDFFYEQIFVQLAGATTGLVYTFMSSSLQNYSSELAMGNVYDPGSMFIFLSSGWQILLSSALWIKIMALIFTGYVGFVVGIVVLISVVIYAINIVKVAFILMLSYVGLGLLIVLAPIFLCFMLFRSTQQMFNVWWQQLLGFMITPPLTFLAVMIFNFLTIAAISSTLNFTACPACLFDIFGWCVEIYRPLIYSSVADSSFVSPFYMPTGLLSTALMLITIVYAMYIFVEYIQVLVARIISYALNPALMGADRESLDVKAAKWLTARDQGTNQAMQDKNLKQASFDNIGKAIRPSNASGGGSSTVSRSSLSSASAGLTDLSNKE